MSELKKEWYVVNTYAGQENRVKENLERRVKTMGLEDSLFQIVVAEEKEIEYKNGKPVEKTHNLFSGYLLVQMIMTDEAWYVVRNTPGVTGFIGSSGKGAKPFPVAQEEVDAVLRRLGRQDVNVQVDFEVGDRVEITNGAYCGFCTMLGLASISDCGIGRAIRGSLGWIVSAFNVFSVLKCHPPLRTIDCLFRR